MTGRTIFGPFGVSLLALIALAVVAIAQVPPLVGAVFTPGVDEIGLDDRIDSLVGQHKKEREIHAARFEGRSAFFEPPAPQEPPRGSTPPPPIVQRDVGPAPDYSGPLKAIGVRDKVIFLSGSNVVTLGVGEERQGVRLIRIDGPFWVTVAWTAPETARERFSEAEYQIPVFEWPGGLFTSVPPQPGMGSELEVPPPVEADLPRGNPNDPRDMMRRRAEQMERGNRGRDDDDDDDDGDDEEIEEDEELVIDDEGTDDGGDAEDDDEDDSGDDSGPDNDDGDGEGDTTSGDDDDDLEENRR